MDNDETFEADIKLALLRRAKGYTYNEVVNEYVIGENGEKVLSKKKVAKKYIPPDITSAKLLLSMINSCDYDFSQMTDSELLEEKNRLQEIIDKGEDDEPRES